MMLLKNSHKATKAPEINRGLFFMECQCLEIF
nr:MAG TPA: hypothetical protein [Caudoviricetes sp.]